MGTLEYVTSQHVAEVEDRTLAHLQIVICSKLRRNERFTLKLGPGDGVSGPVTVLWMTASLPLSFTYSSPVAHPINRSWLHLLAEAASSTSGLWVVPEPGSVTHAAERPGRREKVSA